MNSALKLATERLLSPAALSSQQIEQMLGSIVGGDIDYADLYLQSLYHESWGLEDGVVKEGGYNIARGVGVCAHSDEKSGFAYADDILAATLEYTLGAARSIVKQGGQFKQPLLQPVAAANFYSSDNPLTGWSEEEKVAFLHQVEQEARRQDPRVKQVVVNLLANYETVLIAGSDGALAADIRPLVRLNVMVIVEQKGRRERGSFSGGGRWGYDYFIDQERGLFYAREAVRQALLNLEAVAAPAGLMPVVLGPGSPGILLHEAIGHGLEGDFNRKGSSAFSGRLGQRVASPLCTIVDNGTLPGQRGSLNVDDEGVPTQCTTLIERGILTAYMQDRKNSRLMGMATTGNGRRESYASAPLPRMTNTYMLAGPHDPQEIIASVKRGVYAADFGSGQVDITNGKFVFSASEAYLIENGKITVPIKGATLIGSGPDILTHVSMVGNDLKLDEGAGTCGKDGQSVPVNVGQPTLLVDEMTIGGSQQ
ncbi:MAG: metalloprotease TldD [Gammaproteobacteria bacterium]|nr:metalloprotease TldD [Gammaproteobacteria bacterium]